jgi:hypothetical protein
MHLTSMVFDIHASIIYGFTILPAKLLPWSNLIRKLIGNANGYLPIVLQRNTYILFSTFQIGKTNDRKGKIQLDGLRQWVSPCDHL